MKTKNKQLFHAHVQCPRGSGYMMQSGNFKNAKDAVKRYLELVDKDENPFGRNALINNPEPLMVTLIPAELKGPDAMSYLGFCNVWVEEGSDAFDTEEPEHIFVRNLRYRGAIK